MTQSLSFPGLGLEFAIDKVAITLLGIYWYGIILATGLLVGTLYTFANCKRVGVDSDRLVDVLMFGVVGAIVGARAYFVIFSWELYKDNLWLIFDIRHGGIAIYGAIIGGIIAGMIVAKGRKVAILPALDLAGGGFLIGQAIGRWGNFVNIEAFGSNTNSILGMTGPSIVGYLQQLKRSGVSYADSIDPLMPVHPTFLYESVWCLIGFAIVALFLMKRRRFDGEVFLFYLSWYGLGRFFIEGLRTDSLMWGTLRVSQMLALVCVLVACGVWVWILREKKRKGPDFLPLYIHTPAGQSVVNGTYYQKAAVPEIIVVEKEEEPGDGDKN